MNIKLFETYKSQKELEILSQEIMKRVSKALFNRYQEADSEIKAIPPIRIAELPLEFESKITLQKEYDSYQEIEDFIKNSNTWVYFLPKGFKGTRSNGDFYYEKQWKSRKIRIFLTKKTFENLNLTKDQGFDILNDPKISDEDKEREFNNQMYRFYFHEYESVLLHELQHAYDHYRSEGKAIHHSDEFATKKQKYVDIINSDRLNFLNIEQINFIEDYQKDYLNLKHEVDARFAQAIKNTDMLDTDYEYWKKYDELKVVIKPFNRVLKDFKYNMHGYDDLSQEEQKRVLRKLGQFYELEKDFIKEMNKRNNIKESKIYNFNNFLNHQENLKNH